MPETLIINWSLFTGEDGRYEFSQPFVRGGWMYATNGHICIRVKCDEPDSIGRFPDAPTLFKNIPRANTFTAIGDPVYGDAVHECAACGGMNVRPKDFPSDIEWADDEGDCLECHGFGRLVTGSTERLAGRLIRTSYANRMRALAEVRVGPHGPPSSALFFLFAGGEGVVMPVSR